MAKKLYKIGERRVERPGRAKLSEEESLKRMQTFHKRKDTFVGTIRESKDRGVRPRSAREEVSGTA
jgi:hypothetical protein